MKKDQQNILDDYLKEIDTQIKHKEKFFKGWSALDEPHAEYILQNIQQKVPKELKQIPPGKIELLKKVFSNQIFVDLGAGSKDIGYEMAVHLGATAYIGVEPHNTEKLAKSLEGKKDIPYEILPQDILFALKQLPNNKASFFMSGIDRILIPTWESDQLEYIHDITQLLGDKVHPNGGFFSHASILNSKGTPIGNLKTNYEEYQAKEFSGNTINYMKINMKGLKKTDFQKEHQYILYVKNT